MLSLTGTLVVAASRLVSGLSSILGRGLDPTVSALRKMERRVVYIGLA